MTQLHTCSKCYLDTGWHKVTDLPQTCFMHVLADIDNRRIKFRMRDEKREVSCE